MGNIEEAKGPPFDCNRNRLPGSAGGPRRVLAQAAENCVDEVAGATSFLATFLVGQRASVCVSLSVCVLGHRSEAMSYEHNGKNRCSMGAMRKRDRRAI